MATLADVTLPATWADVQERIKSVQWINEETCSEFIEQLEQVCRDDIELAFKYASVLGRPSQFVDGKIWSVANAKTHWDAFDEYGRVEKQREEDAAANPKKLGRPKTEDPLFIETIVGVKKAAWRQAIVDRDTNVAAYETWHRAEMERLRASKLAYDESWNVHVRNANLAYKTARGY